MPVPNTAFRIACGQFYWSFQDFMNGRVQKNVKERVCKLKIVWPLSIVQTVAVIVICATMFVSEDSVRKEVKTMYLDTNLFDHNDMTVLHTWIFQLAILIRFRKRDPQRFIFHLCFLISRLWYNLSRMATVCVFVFLLLALLICGDVESNPGPRSGIGARDGDCRPGQTNDMISRPRYDESIHYRQQWENSQQGTLYILDQFRADVSHTLSESLKRMEANSQEQGRNIEMRLKRVEEKIDRRLQEVESKQADLESKIVDIQSKYKELYTENQLLKETDTYLTNKCDHLENESKRSNLIFSGFPPLRGVFESWAESESKVKDVIREGMGITDDIIVERAQRHGGTITVKFSSFKQKTMILSNSRKLKESSIYNGIFIHEDFSEIVQEKRKMLLPIQRELRQKGVKANLRFDKLVTQDANYTCDLESRQIKRWERYTWSASRPARTTDHRNTGQVDSGNQRSSDISSQQPNHAISSCLLHTSDFPPLQSANISPTDSIRSSAAHLSNSNPNPQTQQPVLTNRNNIVNHQSTLAAKSQENSSQEEQQYRSRTSQRSTSQYNLRTRGSVADNRSQDIAACSKTMDKSSRGIGRRRSLSPPIPNQRRIDSMFATSQISTSLSQPTPSSPENDPIIAAGQDIQRAQEEDADANTMEETEPDTWS